MNREEAIKRVKSLNLNSKDMEALSTLVPEIVESEDEKMRKIISDILLIDSDEIRKILDANNVLMQDIDSWLEKQGECHISHDDEIMIEQLTEYFTTGHGLQNISETVVEWLNDVKEKLKKQGRLMKALQISNARIGELIEKNYYLKEQFEKQGEHDMGISEATKQKLEDKLHEALEKETSESFNKFLDEQKLADKVEPKFHEGEWIVFNGLTLLVNEVVQGYYRTISKGGITNSYDWDIDKSARLWTIQDVKDGDVLYSLDSNRPFIYKERNGYEQATAYCGLNIYGKFFVWDTKDCVITLSNYVPATKEQRDTLMKAMADAGYTFDFDKKELKKIEQKTATMSLDEAIEHCKEKSCGNNACALEHKQLERWLTELKELKEQNPAWSEEDERMYRGLHNLIYSTPYCDSRKELSDWLKFLKDRVQPKQKQEWSEEDEEALEVAIIALENMYSEDSPLDCYAGHHMPFDKAANQLKYLKERYTWKPSDEQMDALDYYANSLCTYCDRQDDLRSLFNVLKKLREE